MAEISKNLNDTFIYTKDKNIESELYKFIVSAQRIPKKDQGFDDIIYMVKKNQYSSCLNKVLISDNIILGYTEMPLPRAYKIFAAKDVKEDKKIKVFVDVSTLIKNEGGKYILRNSDIGIFISYLVSAMVTLIYYADPTKLTNNSIILQNSTTSFAKMVTNVIDYMRIGSVDNVREKVLYMGAMYFQANILLKDAEAESVTARAKKISGMIDREAAMFTTRLQLKDYTDIKLFIEALARVINVPSLKVDNFIDKWFFLYGAGTQYALELFPAFSNMLTNAYVGAYLNNQKQIEKLVGREMVDYTNAIFRVGSELA